jgi:hypothetical protein
MSSFNCCYAANWRELLGGGGNHIQLFWSIEEMSQRSKFWGNLFSKVRKPAAKKTWNGNQAEARFVPLPPESTGHDVSGYAAVEFV